MSSFLRFAVVALPTCAFALALPISAQSAAQRALWAEPEILQINGNSSKLQDDQTRTGINRPSRGVMLLQGYSNFRASAVLIQQLHDRLEAETMACHFCTPKQEELSELLRQEMMLLINNRAVSDGIGATGHSGMEAFLGADTDNRWTNRERATGEAAKRIDLLCQRTAPLSSSNSGVPGAREAHFACEKRTAGGPYALAESHDRVWSDCFKKHDWVQTPSARTSYEVCMQQDPFVSVCTDLQKSFPDQKCPPVRVTATDVEPLRTYRDRWQQTSRQN